MPPATKSLLSQSTPQLQSHSAKILGTLVKSDVPSKRRGSPDKRSDVQSVISKSTAQKSSSSRAKAEFLPANDAPDIIASRLEELRQQRKALASPRHEQRAAVPSSASSAAKASRVTMDISQMSEEEQLQAAMQLSLQQQAESFPPDIAPDVVASKLDEHRNQRQALASPRSPTSSPTKAAASHEDGTPDLIASRLGELRDQRRNLARASRSPPDGNGTPNSPAVNDLSELGNQRSHARSVLLEDREKSSRGTASNDPQNNKAKKTASAQRNLNSNLMFGSSGNKYPSTHKSVLSHSASSSSNAGKLLESLANQRRTSEHERIERSDSESFDGDIVAAHSETSTTVDLPLASERACKTMGRQHQEGMIPLLHPDDANASSYRSTLDHDIHLEQNPMLPSMICCTRGNRNEGELISRTNKPIHSSQLVFDMPKQPSCIGSYFGSVAAECNVFTKDLYGELLADIE